MVDNLSSFINWAQALMNAKNITQADIARTGYVTTAAVSKLFTYQVKSVGVEMCKAIAEATGTSLETVYRKAGLLPPSNAEDPWVEEMSHNLGKLTGLRRSIAESLVKSLIVAEEKESGSAAAPKATQPR
jgi:transcriptional regulator with XRE-family HTH domain